jgi:DNA-binding transcriptional MerR regulator
MILKKDDSEITLLRGYTIGELAQRSGMRAANIRYYEEIGVLPKADRRESGHRDYGEADLALVGMVKNFRELGFSLDQLRALVKLSKSSERSCAEARDLASEQLKLVQRKLADLLRLERTLEARVADCDATCIDGPAHDCSIFKELAMEPLTARPSRCCSSAEG